MDPELDKSSGGNQNETQTTVGRLGVATMNSCGFCNKQLNSVGQ